MCGRLPATLLIFFGLLMTANGFRASRTSVSKQITPDSGYNETKAKAFLEYSRAVFCSQNALEKWTCGEMCDEVKVVPGSLRFLSSPLARLQGFVAELPRRAGDSGTRPRCVGAFRGTVRKRNWLADAMSVPAPWPNSMTKANNSCSGCYVHAGFAAGYDSLRDEMMDAIKDIGCGSIHFTGHSLGGAMATLATYDARGIEGLKVETTYTFGSPRVGNLAFVEAFNQAAERDGVLPSTWRVVHYRDPVPRLPPTMWPSPFVHLPTEVYYNYEMDSYEICPSTPEHIEDPNCTLKTGVGWCINQQHVYYFNKDLQNKNLPPDCEADESSLVELFEN